MPEGKSDFRPIEVEKKPEYNYPFLNSLYEDHPELAKRVAHEIPDWKKWLEEDTKSPIIADAILQGMDYVSNKEIQESIRNWVIEVTSSLTQSPEKKAIFLLDGGGSGSQRYFAQKVFDELPAELQARITMIGGDAMINYLHSAPKDFDSFISTDYWRFDDSTNSGRQITSMVLPDFVDMGKKLKRYASENNRDLEYTEFVEDSKKFPVFHLRFIRAANYGKNQIIKEWERLQRIYENEAPRVLQFDIKDDGVFPTINEITDKLDLPFDGRTTGPAYLYAQHHVVGYPVLGFFATKIQDNVPAGIVKGKLTPPGLKPLMEQSDITPPWKR